jgi:hypothetical protein
MLALVAPMEAANRIIHTGQVIVSHDRWVMDRIIGLSVAKYRLRVFLSACIV